MTTLELTNEEITILNQLLSIALTAEAKALNDYKALLAKKKDSFFEDLKTTTESRIQTGVALKMKLPIKINLNE